jgi:hypothetical protein
LPDSGVVIVWDVSEDGPPAVHLARLSRDGDPGPTVRLKGSTGADHPEVLVLPDGRAIVAWTERGETAQQVRLARIDLD